MVTRRESVIIEARSNLSTVTARDAAAVALLRREIGGLDGTNIQASKSTDTVTQSVQRQGDAFRKQTASIDQFSGRLRLLSEAAIIGGPALVAMGAVGGGAIAGLASGLGFAALGAGTLTAGLSGVFDTLDWLNKAQLEPTEANLEALRLGMEQLSPAARDMVREIDSLGPVLTGLRDAAAGGAAPQVERLVDNLLQGLPRLRGLFEETSNAAAGVLADGAGILTSERWQPFLNFLEREAPRAIESLGGSAGDAAHGLAEIWRALDPLNDDVLNAIERGAEGFDKWASGLKGSEDFEQFATYIRENGPLLGDAMSAVAGAVLDIAEAAAPLGGPVLQAITNIAEGVSVIADSPFGTPFATALASILAINRALKITAGLSAAASGAAVLGGGRGKAPTVLPGTAVGAAAGAATRGSRVGSIAKDVGVITTGLFALDSGIDILDSFSRTMDSTSVAASDGIGRIRSALEESNVGKYAEDMSIDLDRLAKDVYRFGDSGDYYKRAVDKMQSADNGLRGLGSNVLGFLTPMISDTEKAGLAMLDLDRIAGGTKGALSKVDGEASQVSGEMRNLAEDLFHLGNTQPKLRIDFDKSINGAIGGVRGALEDLDRARARPRAELEDNPFFQNYSRVRGGIGDLDRAKPTPTANLNDAPLNGRLRNAMAGLNVADRFTATPSANLIDNASGPIASINNQLDNIPRFISTTVTTYFKQVGRAFQQKADGGLVTGPGGPRDDAIPTMLSNGEFVVNAASTARNRPLLEQLNARPAAVRAPLPEQPWRQQAVPWRGSSAPAQRQTVDVNFGDARVMIHTPDGGRKLVRLIANVADERIDHNERHLKALAGM